MSVNVNDDACDRCGTCIGVCPENALMLLTGPVIVDKVRCSACGTCVKVCPFGALALIREPAEQREAGERHAE